MNLWLIGGGAAARAARSHFHYGAPATPSPTDDLFLMWALGVLVVPSLILLLVGLILSRPRHHE